MEIERSMEPPLPEQQTPPGTTNAFTAGLAQMLIAKGIRVNCVAPGPVWTPLTIAATGGKPFL